MGAEVGEMRNLHHELYTGFLVKDGSQSIDPGGWTDDVTAPSKLDLPRSRRGHVQLNRLCRPTAPANKSVRDHNSLPKPRKPRPQTAEDVRGGVGDVFLTSDP